MDGSIIRVTDDFRWETLTNPQACTDDCCAIEVRCAVGPLAAGDYTVRHGADEYTLTIPTDDTGCDPFGG